MREITCLCGGLLRGSWEAVTCQRCGKSYRPTTLLSRDGILDRLDVRSDEVVRFATGSILVAVQYREA